MPRVVQTHQRRLKYESSAIRLEVEEPALGPVLVENTDNVLASANASFQALRELRSLWIEGQRWEMDDELADIAHQLQVWYCKRLVLVRMIQGTSGSVEAVIPDVDFAIKDRNLIEPSPSFGRSVKPLKT